ncbi:hypothetical protein [Streptacidiphilus neutrinimicus]|uniref:hypothetical protein n=1 Tax=Streptacidiphilus neutrinimicus TaxID=105420 RepID=UPI001269CB15|nr:hypothetical protein [Streptacidiphilus neutrinimicus]
MTPVLDVDLPASGTVVWQVCAPIGFAYAVAGAGCVLDTAAVLRVSAGDCGYVGRSALQRLMIC